MPETHPYYEWLDLLHATESEVEEAKAKRDRPSWLDDDFVSILDIRNDTLGKEHRMKQQRAILQITRHNLWRATVLLDGKLSGTAISDEAVSATLVDAHFAAILLEYKSKDFDRERDLDGYLVDAHREMFTLLGQGIALERTVERGIAPVTQAYLLWESLDGDDETPVEDMT